MELWTFSSSLDLEGVWSSVLSLMLMLANIGSLVGSFPWTSSSWSRMYFRYLQLKLQPPTLQYKVGMGLGTSFFPPAGCVHFSHILGKIHF